LRLSGLDLGDLLSDEFVQRRQSGYDVADLEDPILQASTNGSVAECERLFELLEEAPRREDWAYEEPSELREIRSVLPEAPSLPELEFDEDCLHDRLQAAWLGRCAGCVLGKPVEGWDRETIRSYLQLARAYPLDDYVPRLEPMPYGYEMHPSWPEVVRGSVRFVARDDDIDYTILGLHILETRGFDFGPEDVAETWMSRVPFLATYTAERAAYRNLVCGLRPPDTATYRNPYREWIGAQIRADMWGYVSPGDLERAAELAFKDAAFSHTRNGIYGEMWASALVAASFVAPSMRIALEAALTKVPPRARLAEALRYVFSLRERGLGWEGTRNELEERYGHYSFVHTINNAAVVAAALMWGEGDYARTIGLAVQGGWDTDCNGATAGSAFGAMHGMESLPGSWVEPLNDRVRSAVTGFDDSRISDLAERTLRLVGAYAKGSREPGM
jgi:ADP-ribosylglycohydrolase